MDGSRRYTDYDLRPEEVHDPRLQRPDVRVTHQYSERSDAPFRPPVTQDVQRYNYGHAGSSTPSSPSACSSYYPDQGSQYAAPLRQHNYQPPQTPAAPQWPQQNHGHPPQAQAPESSYRPSESAFAATGRFLNEKYENIMNYSHIGTMGGSGHEFAKIENVSTEDRVRNTTIIGRSTETSKDCKVGVITFQ
jgi:hypothetical protein